MRNTFLIEGNGSSGTAFLIGKPTRPGSEYAWKVLVTAKHVLDSMKGDFAVINLRKKIGDQYINIKHRFKIRENNINNYTSHPKMDVAAMYMIDLPKEVDIPLLSFDFLATDSMLVKYNIHPGDELFSLGFPFGAFTPPNFPILRSGRIASFPLTPSNIYNSFLLDIEIFKGNSGGPVYFIDKGRYFEGKIHLSNIVQFIIGIIIREYSIEEKVESLYEVSIKKHPLSLAVVIHATYIRETINLLPKLR